MERSIGVKRIKIIYVKKTKTMIRSENVGKVTIENKFLCAICRKGVGSISILCQFYKE